MDPGGGDDGGGDDDPSWFDRWENRTESDDASGTTDEGGRREDGAFGTDADGERDTDGHAGGSDGIGSRGRAGERSNGGGRGGFRNEGGDVFDHGRSHRSTGGTDGRNGGRDDTEAGSERGAGPGGRNRPPENGPSPENVGDRRTGANDPSGRNATGTAGNHDTVETGGDSTRITTIGNETGVGGGHSSATRGEGPTGDVGDRVRWALRTDHPTVSFARELLSSLAIVAAVGLLLFAVSGIWPPMVAVESQSMNPHLKTGDLVFVMEEHRFAASAAYEDTGVVPYRTGRATNYDSFGAPGDVIIYRANGESGGTPIIHRARFWVNQSENWYDEANPDYIGDAANCMELANCPAPHAGFITKGDNNQQYDQVGDSIAGPVGTEGRISSPVQPDWITGTGEFRVPKLGCVRLFFSAETPRQCTP